MKFHDAHCHISSKKFLKDFNLVECFPKWQKQGIEKVIGVSTKISESLRIIELSNEYKQIVPGIGIHPWSAKKALDQEIKQQIIKLVSKTENFVIGEIGLDHHFIKKEGYYPYQEETFRFFLGLAERKKLPVNIHLKGAERLGADILSSYKIHPKNVLIHWYSGPLKVLEEFIEEGYFFTINPSILSDSPHVIVLNSASISQILTESDGNVKYTIENKRIIGSPGIIPRVVEKISKILNKDIEELSIKLEKNLQKYLNQKR